MPPRKSRKARGKSKKRPTLIRLERGLRAGGVTTVRYTKGLFYKLAHPDYDPPSAPPPDQRSDAPKRAWRPKYSLSLSKFILITVAFALGAVLIFNNTSLTVQRLTVSIPGLSKELEGYTILHISDLHGAYFGANQSQITSALSSHSYHMVVISGDMVGAGGNPQPFFDLLSALPRSRPVYFVAGDSDPGPLLEHPNPGEGNVKSLVLEPWILEAEARGAIYLDQPASLNVSGSVIWLTPGSQLNLNTDEQLAIVEYFEDDQRSQYLEEMTDELYDALPLTNYRHQKLRALDTAIRAMKPEDLHIVVSHYPIGADQLTGARRLSESIDPDNPAYLREVDLALGGHYCGGVWKIPFLGAVYIPAIDAPRHGWFPDPEDVEGLKPVGNAYIHTSGGLGVTDRVYVFPRIRLLNTPKMTLLRLTGTLPEDIA